jgi:predicted lipid-binding transport protein (Tim44 family)
MKRQLAAIALAGAAFLAVAGNAAAQRIGTDAAQWQSNAPSAIARLPSLQAQTRAAMPADRSSRSGPSDAAAPAAGNAQRGGADPIGVATLTSLLAVGGISGDVVVAALLLVLVVLGFMIIGWLLRRPDRDRSPMREPVFAGGQAAQPAPTGARMEPQSMSQGISAPRVQPAAGGHSGASWGVPAEFDAPGFLRSAKAYFIRLQASWDKADIRDISAFTTPEMFAELSLQLEERGAAVSQTDVAILNADLLGIETTGTAYVASVKFSGMIKEAGQPMAEPFIEIWSLSRPVAGPGEWLLGGIQQLQ